MGTLNAHSYTHQSMRLPLWFGKLPLKRCHGFYVVFGRWLIALASMLSQLKIDVAAAQSFSDNDYAKFRSAGNSSSWSWILESDDRAFASKAVDLVTIPVPGGGQTKVEYRSVVCQFRRVH